jgi:hypothetical protein
MAKNQALTWHYWALTRLAHKCARGAVGAKPQAEWSL